MYISLKKRNSFNAWRMIFLFCIAFILIQADAQADTSKALRLFLIGNSFSQNASRYLPQLAKDGGYKLVIGRAELGGCPLQRHWDSVAVNLQDSSRGKAYSGKSLKQLLSSGKWDIVTIQQASILSADSTTYQPYASLLYSFIKTLQPNAKVLIHQTWPYRIDAPSFAQTAKDQYAGTAKEMWQKSREAYHKVAADLGIQIIPVGDAFEMTQEQAAAQYTKANFNKDTFVYPSLPPQKYSLHVGYFYNKQKLELDTHHASAAGCYLAGLVWYSLLFHTSPQNVSFKPDEVSPAFAKVLKRIANKVIVGYMKKDKVID